MDDYSNAHAANVGGSNEKQHGHYTHDEATQEILFVSGLGQFHTNEADINKPDKVLTPYLAIGVSAIRALVDNPQQVDKPQAQWLIPSTYPSRCFKAQEQHGQYWALWADLDKSPPYLSTLALYIEQLLSNCNYELYNSHSATQGNQKARVLILLDQPLCYEDWTLAQQTLNDELEAKGILPDRANERAAQICYLPNKGDLYTSESKRNGQCFNPVQLWAQEIAAKREKIESERAALEAAKRVAMAKREALKLPDNGNRNLSKEDAFEELKNAFNEVYTPHEWMIKAGYAQRGDSFRHPFSESGNYSATVKEGRVNALSSSDLLYTQGQGAHDAFSVYATLFHGSDNNAAAIEAGDSFLAIGCVCWNKAKQREYTKQQTEGQGTKQQANNADWNGDIDFLFNDIVLTQEHVDKMANTRFLIPNIIAQGHLAVYAAPANGGKSALFRYFCETLSKDGMKVIYVNVDAGPGDLKKHYTHAKEHNYKVIAPDACEGKSADDVTEQLRTISDSSVQCGEYVFILDTLKKFTDVINKTKAKEFYKLLRKLTVKGATICLLGHCNKYKDEEGRHIYEGTADLRNDIDDLIYLDSSLNEQTNILVVTTRPDKVRAEFHPVSFNIDKNNGLKVTPADKIINILPDEDREIIDLAKWAIKEGNESQGDIIEYVKERLDGVGDRKIKSRLKFYSTGPRAELKATTTGLGRGLKYEVVY